MGSAEQVNELLQFLPHITPTEAQNLLQQNNNDVQATINTYFEPPSSQDATVLPMLSWDETVFHSDRIPHGPQTETQASHNYNIHSHDTLNPAGNESGISRPPSRVSNKNWSNTVLSTGQGRQLSIAEQDDLNYKKAVAMSLSQTLPDQETGVTDENGTHFGPATQPFYETDKWALTPFAQEVIQHPDAEFRKHMAGIPSFLAPSSASQRLPAIVTILHAIPLAREAFILRDYMLADYGYSPTWWDGSAIRSSRIVDLTQPSDSSDFMETVYEAQRLMAFLDQTDRAYGSIEVLSSMEGVRDRPDPEGGFLETWHNALQKKVSGYWYRDIFRSRAIVGDTTKDFHILDLTLEPHITDRGLSMYEALDDALTVGYKSTDPDDTYLSKVADIFIIGFSRDGQPGLGIEIPSVWYADRYLEESKIAVKEMRKGKDALLDEVKKIEERQSKLSKMTLADGKIVDASKVHGIIKNFFEQTPDHVIKRAKDDVESVSNEMTTANTYSSLAEELQRTMDRIVDRLKNLEVARVVALEKMRELSSLYTKPVENDMLSPCHRYTLRGVATDTNVTYVLKNPIRPHDLIDTYDVEWQWWKIRFVSGNTSPITYTKVGEDEVLEAARDESQRAILVYANDKAMSAPIEALPGRLEDFVHADNVAFAAELAKTTMTPVKRKASDSPSSSSINNSPHWGDESPPATIKFAHIEHADIKGNGLASPPAYIRSKPVPALSRSTSVARNRLSYDDIIPMCLELPTEASVVKPTSTTYEDIDLLADEPNREMEERSSGMGIVPGGTGAGVGEYALGNYTPEISMDDLEDPEEEKKIRT